MAPCNLCYGRKNDIDISGECFSVLARVIFVQSSSQEFGPHRDMMLKPIRAYSNQSKY